MGEAARKSMDVGANAALLATTRTDSVEKISLKGQRVILGEKINSYDDADETVTEDSENGEGKGESSSRTTSTVTLVKDLDNDEEYESRKGIASLF
jgi:hypothetical protein